MNTGLSLALYAASRSSDECSVDQEEIVQQVIAALGMPVFGTVDAEKNITLTGELADGTYTLHYEDAEGNHVMIGTIELGGIINRLPISTDADGTVYNAAVTPGYKSGVRLSSSANYTEKAVTDRTIYLTGYIPVAVNDVVRFANMKIPKGTDYESSIYIFDTNKANGGVLNAQDIAGCSGVNPQYDSDNNLIQFTASSALRAAGFSGGYLRFGASLIDSTSIITVNEEIK